VWTASYFTNAALVSSVDSQVARTAREFQALGTLRPADETKLVAALTRLRELREASATSQSLFQHAGLYTGDKLAAQASRAYRNALREALIADLAYAFENALRARPDTAVLEAYISLHDDAKRNAATVAKGALAVWALPEAARAELQTHLLEALTERPLALPRPRDDALIEQARRRAGVTRA